MTASPGRSDESTLEPLALPRDDADKSDLDDLYDRQAGVVARHQLLDLEVNEGAIRNLLRRGHLVQQLPGVYLNHNGEPTWLQRSWIAILFLGDAALCHASAIRADDGPGRPGTDDGLIHIAIDRRRSPAAPPGVRLHYVAHLEDKVRWNASPPRVRIEHAVVDVAAEARDDMRAIATLADAVQARRTTATRLLEVVQGRSRLARRQLLLDVLGDIAEGTHSALEHAYLARVERPHGLPVGSRQVAGTGVYRDVVYAEWDAYVELDGRLFHDNASQRDEDLDRDLDAEVEGRRTVRLGWGQVVGRSCATATRVGAILQRRGWAGEVVPCPECTPRDLAAAS